MPPLLGDSGGVSSWSPLAGPVGHNGMCLLGTGGCCVCEDCEEGGVFRPSSDRGGVTGAFRVEAGR